MHFLNLHTHFHPFDSNAVSVFNVHENFEQDFEYLVSCGLHPWYLDERTVEFQFASLVQSATHSKVLAIGECGLDKLCKTPWELQFMWFSKQVDLANSVGKPLVIHCVRAHDEVLSVLLNRGNLQPVIFHGFNKKLELAYKVLEAGAYLSFGKHLMSAQGREVFSKVPLDKFFLETDNQELTIQEVYTFAAETKNIPVEELKFAVASNAKKVFGPNFQL